MTFNGDLLSVKLIKYKLQMLQDGLMLASNDTPFFSILDAIYISWNTGITVAVKLIMTIERLLIPRNSPKRFGTRSDRADFCTVDCYTYCNKVEIHIYFYYYFCCCSGLI